MKNSKYCQVTAGCRDHRHEVFGIVLLVIAALLTIFTCSAIGIAAMFLVGFGLCCHKHWSCHCNCQTCHPHDHCDASGDGMVAMNKSMVKKATVKTKSKA